MQRSLRTAVAGIVISGIIAVPVAHAAPNWNQLIPFKKVEADPNREYTLTEDHGPWLIMCRSFAGDTAPQEAHALVLELRQKFKLKAYVHKKNYDFTKKERGLGVDKYGNPKVMKADKAVSFDEIAVLVGDFESVEDSKLQDVLEKVKYARPKCLELVPGKDTSQRYAGLREVQKMVSGYVEKNSAIKDKGPMRSAFVTRNPLLPDEYFAPKGLDQFVIDLNRDVEYSLLKNKAKFTVRVASFQGESTMKLKKIEEKERETIKTSRLEEGAIKAHKIVMALRAQNVEAWEFHDRNESIVTIGSFDSVSQPRADGKEEINPAVHAIMERYKAQGVQVRGQQGVRMGPQQVAGISLDVQPIPVAVPKKSFGQTYARGNR